ncbi:putative bifunctional diguanylate cyclase/phosphodiesterase [Nakamurella deserti]|uniref:putative bifunctional diguanylate cyclase/phosphodiesterase n=1 Tax=Nakamurella deserti TaxID=2164074 RepID=UPI000DBE4553|nr:EAL domain-containing protein [Nakamurella deserti]
MLGSLTPRASTVRLMVVAAVVVLAIGGVFVGSERGTRGITVFGDLTQLVLSAFAGAAALVTSFRTDGALRASWRWIGFGVSGWACGQLVYCYYELVADDPAPLPSLADVGFLMFPIGVAVGLWKFPTSQPPGIRIRNVLDGVVVVSSMLVISWWTVLRTVYETYQGEPMALVVSMAYPIGDVLFVAMVVYSLSRPGPFRRPLLLLTAALTAMAVADSSYAYLSATDRYATGALSDLGWVVAFVLIAVTAIRPPKDAETFIENPVSAHDVPFIVPFLPLLAAAAVVIVVQLVTQRTAGPIDFVCFAVGVAGVVGRQYLTYSENRRLMAVVAAREDQLRRQATSDLLTGLTNRALFNDRVGHALELHRRDLRPLAIMFCDLDDFKAVNDTFGHPAGDELLIRVSDRLRGALRTGDTLARFGGDEFAILIEDGGESTAVGARIIEALRPPFTVAGSLLTVRMSVGMIEVKPDDPSPTLEALLANADLAMYSAKRSGKGKLALYDPTMMAPNVLDLPLQKPLAAAIADGRITAVYQPVVSLTDGMVVGLEALARWRHEGADVPPSQFVPLAMRAGLIGGLTTVMLRTACADVADWSRRLGHRDLRVAVNVPPSLITDPGFPARMADVLGRWDMNADQLVLEITEDALLGDIATVTAVTRSLSALGLPLALDDFGKGYSSLVNLQHIPLRILKIDMAFVAEIDRDPRAERLIRALLRLGSDLGLDMVAEGVERPAQAAVLRELGCPFAQGNLFARPAPADKIFALLGRPLQLDLDVEAR